jgi:hypothetical protein
MDVLKRQGSQQAGTLPECDLGESKVFDQFVIQRQIHGDPGSGKQITMPWFTAKAHLR